MASLKPLYGNDLIDCARANVGEGINIAAERCGYDDLAIFELELRKAANSMGVKIHDFKDLMAVQKESDVGVIVAPETPTNL
jgi:hypothetical protein